MLPIPVATEKRPDPRLALTIGVAGWIADSKDFGRGPSPYSVCSCLHVATHSSHMLANQFQVLCRPAANLHLHLLMCVFFPLCIPMLASQNQVMARYLQPQLAVSRLASIFCCSSSLYLGCSVRQQDVQTSLDIVYRGCMFLARTDLRLTAITEILAAYEAAILQGKALDA